jgi:hypothetical protein
MHLENKGLIFLKVQLQICFGAKEHFKENDVQQKEFLEDLGLLIMKNHLLM